MKYYNFFKKNSYIFEKYPLIKNKYLLTSIFMICWILFIDTNSVYNQKKLKKDMIEVEESIYKLKEDIKKDKEEIEKLKTIEGMEYVAREEYWMKKDNEDLFIMEVKKK